MKYKPFSNPILIVSDNPALRGGLSRMCVDLASLCCTMPDFRVAVLGRGIGQSRSFPWITYDFPEDGQWGETYIQDAWEDFTRGETTSGVIITLDDATRRRWFVNPVGMPLLLQKFLGEGRNFQRWMYLPLDSVGPSLSRPGFESMDTILRYDRVLMASEWAYDSVRNIRKDVDWLPHGLNGSIFHVQPDSRKVLGWEDDKVVVGCVMSNQSRKDMAAAFEAFSKLKEEYGNRFMAWLHTDVMIRHWNIYALVNDYGLNDHIEISSVLTDHQMALRYSACDCTILPSAGEGFGFPIAESLACGTPCVVTGYAGGQELVEESCRIRPIAYRVDGPGNCNRAVLSGYAFGVQAIAEVERKRSNREERSEELAHSVAHLDWNVLRTEWEKWLRAGLK